MCETHHCHHEQHQPISLQPIGETYRSELHMHLGAACCSGHCSHPEHLQAALHDQLLDVETSDDDDEEYNNQAGKNKTNARKTSTSLLQLANVRKQLTI